MNKQLNIAVSHPEKRVNGWYVKALFGPFETKEEADIFVNQSHLLETTAAALSVEIHPAGNLKRLLEITAELQKLKDETPPTLGINVSETIKTADKFG